MVGEVSDHLQVLVVQLGVGGVRRGVVAVAEGRKRARHPDVASGGVCCIPGEAPGEPGEFLGSIGQTMGTEPVDEGGVAVGRQDVCTGRRVVGVDGGHQPGVLQHRPGRPEFRGAGSPASDQLLSHATVEQGGGTHLVSCRFPAATDPARSHDVGAGP